MNLVLVPLTMKLLFLLPNLHLKYHVDKEKIASENGTTSAQWKFQSSHGAIGESTVWLFKKKYEAMIKVAARKQVSPKKAIAARKWGQPVLLGEMTKWFKGYF